MLRALLVLAIAGLSIAGAKRRPKWIARTKLQPRSDGKICTRSCRSNLYSAPWRFVQAIDQRTRAI